jgi:acyl dehydratase
MSDLKPYVGRELSVSDWMEITRERITTFADATEDHQWIHTDPVRAMNESPWKSTIAHGFLTLALLSTLFASASSLGSTGSSLNYGFNRIRFPTTVVTGGRIRARFELTKYEELEGGARLTWDVLVECDWTAKPALVAEWIMQRMLRELDRGE